MEDVLANISTVIWSLVGAAMLALFGYFGKKLSGWHSEHVDLVHHLDESEGLKAEVEQIKRMQEPQNDVLRELMGIKIDEEHTRLVRQGYASPDEKLAFERRYKAYHSIKGNGTRTALYEDVLQMKSYPTG